MPKTTNTRLQRAEKLAALLKRGPAFVNHPEHYRDSSITLADHYRIWFDSWVDDELADLIPELRKAKVTKNAD